MVTRASLLLSILSFVLLTWLLSHWLETDRVCVSLQWSRGVWIQKSSGELVAIPFCEGLSRLYEPNLDPLDRQLLKKSVAQLERLATILPQWLGPSWIPPQVVIDFSDPMQVDVNNEQLQLGAALMSPRGMLEKVIIQAALSNLKGADDRYALEVLSDYLAAVVINSFSFEDLQGEALFAHDPFFWNTFVQSFREYCYSPLKSVFHLDYCINQNGLLSGVGKDVETPNELTIWGLRPYFAYHLWMEYRSLSLLERDRFLRKVLAEFQSVPFSYPTQVENLHDLKDWSHLYLNLWLRREKPKEIKTDVDLLIYARDMSSESFQNIHSAWGKESKLSLDTSVLFIFHDQSIHQPTGRVTPVDFTMTEAEQAIVVACGRPKFQDLSLVQSQKMVVVQACANSTVDWSRILKEGFAKLSQRAKQGGVASNP